MGVGGATVQADLLGPAGWMPLAVESTSGTGECDLLFAGPKPTFVKLTAGAAGYRSTEVFYLPRPTDVIPWVTIALKGARSLEGHVVTEDGQGVEGATVAMNSPAGMLHTLTRKSGAFWFDDLMPIKAVLAVQVPGVGIGAYRVDLTKDKIDPVEIVLHSQRQATLQLLGDGGKPLPGVMVEVLAPQTANVVTDAAGQIQINGLGAGPSLVVVSMHDEYYRLDEPTVSLPVDGGTEPVELEVMAYRGGLLQGQVVDRETGEPIPAAVVWFVYRGRVGPNMTCDVEGKFEFQAIPEDDYLLAAGYATYGFAVATANVEDGKKTTVKFALPAGATVQGVVTGPNGKPVSRAIVRAAEWVPPQSGSKDRGWRDRAVADPLAGGPQ